MRTFRDLIVWQRAIELCLDVYRITESFPANERFGMTSEFGKTVRSVSYNIAEGHRRRSTLEYIRFLDIARGSAAELETQIVLVMELDYLEENCTKVLLADLAAIDRMLAALMARLRDGDWFREPAVHPSPTASPLDPSGPF